jgi:TetR/AcrR family transcriptional repressor of nem operon
MGRKSDGRERLLEAASTLLSQRSYSSIGVAEICTAAGVQKGSFYYYFESKQALALAVIEEHWTWQRAEWAKILDAADPLLDRLRRLFRLTAEIQVTSLAGTGSVTGCLFGNLALEMSGQDDPIRERLQGIFDEQIDMVERALKEAMDSGQVPTRDARDAAKSIVAQLEGLVLFAKLFNDPAQLDRLWENSLSLLGAGEPAGTPAILGV